VPATATAAQPSAAARAIGLASYNEDVRRVAGLTLTCLILGLIIAGVGAWPYTISGALGGGVQRDGVDPGLPVRHPEDPPDRGAGGGDADGARNPT
jgi:hypothetical protein